MIESLPLQQGSGEHVPLSKAHGRVLAVPLRAAQSVPAFDNAAMDGYALWLDSCVGEGPWRLSLSGRIAAGDLPAAPQTGAVRIFTGAPLPQGADAVVMQEHVRHTAGWIEFSRRPEAGENIRRKGEEIEAGETVLPAGSRLTSRALAVAASVGQGSVEVTAKVRVAVVTSGNEVRPAGTVLSSGQVSDVNGPLLAALLLRPDVELVSHVHVKDTLAAHVDALSEAAGRADLVITTGGLSVGEEDHMRHAIAALGGEIMIPAVNLKPGKPVSLGSFGGAFWLGLPGNPMAAFVTYTLLGLPLLDRLTGGQAAPMKRIPLSGRLTHSAGRTEARPASLDPDTGHVMFGGPVQSARMSPLVGAEGLALIPGDVAALDEGDLVDYLPFSDGV